MNYLLDSPVFEGILPASAQAEMDAMDEDIPYIEQEWKSALAVVAVVLTCIILIVAVFWL